MKIYRVEHKYGGEEYEVMASKLNLFYDLCGKVEIGQELYQRAFSIMLKGRASQFYYNNLIGVPIDFARMVEAVRAHFETPEVRQKYLSDWRNTTLTKVIQSNPNKTKLECLELLIEKLQKIIRRLGKNEEELREQLLNACRGIPECNFALFKPATNFQSACAELRNAIGTAITHKQTQDAYIQGQEGLEQEQGQHELQEQF
jgi:hypothetical protein